MFIFQKRIVQNSYCLVRHFTLQIIKYQENQPEEHLLKYDDNYTCIRKENAKFLKIALVGAPNAGKSTVINSLINRNVCPTSSKVHTTQFKCNAIYSSENTQLVFVDTPGLTTPKERSKYHLNSHFEKDPQTSAKAADVVGIVHDVGNRWTRNKLHTTCLDLLNSLSLDIPTLLILNKVDKIKDKKILLESIRVLTSKNNWPNFVDVFLISALHSDGVDNLRDYLLCIAKSREWQYSEDTYIDQSQKTIVKETIRAKLMNFLDKELPYELHIIIEYFEEYPDGGFSILANIECPTKKKASFVIGKKAEKIKMIANQCEEELQHAFRRNVQLKLNVCSKKG